MARTRWGIIGPGRIAHNFADGLKEAPSGVLAAIASRNSERRRTFGDDYGLDADKRHDTYEALMADPEVDAVYISTPHPFHAALSIQAMRGGKAVLCEKPAGLNAAEVTAVTEVAAQMGVFFMEAFMYRCHPQIARMLDILRSGEIGDLVHMRAAFGFSSGFDAGSRLYDRKLGGGGILDVGGYPVSLARLVAGVAVGRPFNEPEEVKGVGQIGRSGVDEVAYGLLRFESGFTAEIACAIARAMDNSALVSGTRGTLKLDDPWVPGRNAGPSDAIVRVTVDGKERVEELKHPQHLFAFEAEAASKAIAEGKREAAAPAMTHADSIGNNAVLDRWRAEVGYATVAEEPTLNRITPGVMPAGFPSMPPSSGTHGWRQAATPSTRPSSMAVASTRKCWASGSRHAASPRTWSSSRKAHTRLTARRAQSRRSSTSRWIGWGWTSRLSTSCIVTIPTCRWASSWTRSTSCTTRGASASSAARTGRWSALPRRTGTPRPMA
jgi:predicted dehydrogenase